MLSNEVKLKEDIKLKMTSSSMGNIVSGHALSSLLNQEAVKPENITMKLFKIADTRPSLIVRNVMRLKAQDVLPNTIKTEDLKKLKIIVPHIEENFDFIHPEEAVEDFKSNMIMLGRKFDQQSIILGTEDGVFEVDKVGKKLTKFKNSPDIVTNKDAENFMTQLISRGNRAFKLSAISTIEDNLKQ